MCVVEVDRIVIHQRADNPNLIPRGHFSTPLSKEQVHGLAIEMIPVPILASHTSRIDHIL